MAAVKATFSLKSLLEKLANPRYETAIESNEKEMFLINNLDR